MLNSHCGGTFAECVDGRAERGRTRSQYSDIRPLHDDNCYGVHHGGTIQLLDSLLPRKVVHFNSSIHLQLSVVNASIYLLDLAIDHFLQATFQLLQLTQIVQVLDLPLQYVFDLLLTVIIEREAETPGDA